MRIDPGIIRDVLARTDLAGLIGAYVSLNKRGNDLVGLCPFHGEKTPSFHVHPDRGFYKCFGCGAGGDAIRFLSQIENVPFPEAVRTLAKRAGIELEAETPAAARARSEKELIYQANELAVGYFQRMLAGEKTGAKARAYCERRGISAESITAFKLGFAPDRWDGLVEELQGAGIDLALAAKAGLVKPGQRGYYDFYRGRLMIPTLSTTGEVVAFGGRALGDEEPKYLNTTTTPVYTKGRGLFALNVARRNAASAGAFIVVEGYLDCIALHQAGFTNAVASLGTAFTAEQAGEIKKYCPNVFLCFDGDRAGEAATIKSIDTLVAAGCSARIVRLPGGADPDSFVRGQGAEAFRGLLESATPWIEFKLERQVETIRGGFRSAAEIAREAESMVRSLPQEEWDRWRVYVAGRLNLSVDDLRRSRFTLEVSGAAHGAAPRVVRHAPAVASLSFERDVLEITLAEPSLLAEFASRIPPERFASPALRRLYTTMVEQASELTQPSDVLALFSADDEAMAVLTALDRQERSGAVRFVDTEARRRHLERVVQRLCEDDERARMRELDRRIDELLVAGQPVPRELRDEFSTLVSKLKK